MQYPLNILVQGFCALKIKIKLPDGFCLNVILKIYIFHQNVCVSNPCLNNGTCFTGYTSKKYLCVCTFGFKGENCKKAPGKIVQKIDITWPRGSGKLNVTIELTLIRLRSLTNLISILSMWVKTWPKELKIVKDVQPNS